MSSTREFEGQSEQEAVEKACAALNVASEELDYTVLDEGSGGVFGLGARPVQIRVRVPEGNGAADASAPSEAATPGRVGPAPEKAAQALEVAEGLVARMGLEAKVTVRDDHEEIVIVIDEVEEGSDVADVLGRSRPPAIPSFQFLLNKIVNRFPEDRKHIVVEVPSVPRRERRPPGEGAPSERSRAPAELDPDLDPTLVALARSLAERSMALNKVITVHPMLPSDRRAVHQTITTVDGVQTVSEGEGLYRRMHIVPDSLRGASGTKKRRRRRRRRRREDGEPEGADGPDSAAEAPAVAEAAEHEDTELPEAEI